jgi:hypothetical protein
LCQAFGDLWQLDFAVFSGRNPSIAAGALAVRTPPADFVHFVSRRPQKLIGRLGHLGQHGQHAGLAKDGGMDMGATGTAASEKCRKTLLTTGSTPAAPVGNPSFNKTKGMCTAVKDSLESFLAG